jgi:hypothetical protein
VNRRWRTLRYGTAVALVVAGVACGATVPGTLGVTLATALVGIGLVAVLSLVFYEVGLSEDRDRARERSVRAAGGAAAGVRSADGDPPGDRGMYARRRGRRRGEHGRRLL